MEVMDVLMNFCLMDKFVSGKRGRTGYEFRGNIFGRVRVAFFWGWEDFDMQFAGYILLVKAPF